MDPGVRLHPAPRSGAWRLPGFLTLSIMPPGGKCASRHPSLPLAGNTRRRPPSRLTAGLAGPCNDTVDAEQREVISAEPPRIPARVLRLIGATVAAAALVAALVAAIHDHGGAAAHRRGPPPATTALPQVSSIRYALPPDGPVTGEVTVFSVRSARGAQEIVLAAQLAGGRPHTRYQLVGIDCSASAETDRTWASGTSDATGAADLTGPGQRVTRGDFYALGLSPSPQQQAPGLHGYLAVSGLYAFPRGNAPCSP